MTLSIQFVMNWVTLIVLSTYLMIAWRLVDTKMTSNGNLNRDPRNVHWTRLRQLAFPRNRLKRSPNEHKLMKRNQAASNNPYWRMSFKRQNDSHWTRLKKDLPWTRLKRKNLKENNWIRISKLEYPY